MQRIGLLMILASCVFSALWGLAIGRTVPGGSLDFQGLYYGTRCLLQHHNPYNVSELEAVYRADGGESPSESIRARQIVTLYVNLPTTLLYIAPLSILPWGIAHLLWMFLTAGSLILAAFLMWDLGSVYAPVISGALVCFLLGNSEILFATGNAAGIAVSLCLVAVWCFLKGRFVLAGVLCMALSLSIKPHDAGLVWLFFLLAGGVYRKRAIQTLLITAVLGLSAFLLVSHVAPHWMQAWRSNISALSAPGGLNEPGPDSVTSGTAGMVIGLPAAISVLCDDPRIYNAASYLICGALLLVWSLRTLKSQLSQSRDWLALASVAALTLAATYHRPYDAKLLLLTVPACAMMWSHGGPARWVALLLNAAGIVLTGDVPLTILVILTNSLHINSVGIFGRILKVVLVRPTPLSLLALCIFYLWVYVRCGPALAAGAEPGEPRETPLASTPA
jgi:hypothetical protein